MLASTVQFSKNGRPPTNLAACRHTTRRRFDHSRGPTAGTNRPEGQTQTPDPSGPNSVPDTTPTPHTVHSLATSTGAKRPEAASTNRCSTLEHPLPHTRGQTGLCTDQDITFNR